ncbi:MAG: hypothetical protein DDT32_01625 [Syntrophomonadaceae bacterium]|nr:hypothetical protein [Bacillota bacterium]MBT9147859.1 hypothetical protein [Bacillota bacterium]
MKLYLQMGHGMQTICKEFSQAWNGATVILSPQNIHPTNKLSPFATSLRKVKGSVLFDPQLYAPQNYQKNLQKHDYWPQSDLTSIELGDCHDLLAKLAGINAEIDSEAFMLPSRIINKIDDRWGKNQGAIASQARQVANGQRLLLTVALGKEVLVADSQVEKITQLAKKWDIDGVYIVCEHPERHYLVDRPIWIANLLSLVAGIKRLGKEVIVGYANHQMLPLALAKCDAIAAGNFLNVRWFQPEHFETTDKDEQSRRTTWYYCPQALSEFKVTYLDVAKRAGILATMATPAPMENKYSRILFGGATPSLTNYKEGDSFKHYLHCLRIQCELASKSTYDETRNAQFAQLETAARILNGLHNERIKGQHRDFGEIADVNEAAIQIFDKEFGFAMAQEW